MSDKMIENNQVSIVGEVMSPFVFSHEVFGEGFYMADIKVARLSESMDIIPVMVSERLIDVTADYRGTYVYINGQFRSFNRTVMCGLFFLHKVFVCLQLRNIKMRDFKMCGR